MLEPIFGESGAVVVQYVITFALVLVMVALIYWLYQYLSSTRIKTSGRGRIPRLAVIDALPVDGRRKLVLIRRDHVEHLILIGGTSDLVVEPSIIRGVPSGARQRPGQPPRPQQSPAPGTQPAAPPVRQPPQQATQTATPRPQETELHRPEEPGISEPIPFPQAKRPTPVPVNDAEATTSEPMERSPQPQRRAAVRRTAPVEEAALVPASEPASAHFEEPARPTRIESVVSLAGALDEIDEPTPANDIAASVERYPTPAARPENEAVAIAPEEFAEETADDVATETIAVSPEPAPATAAEAIESDDSQSATAERVGDLEREMARLLDEITAKRES